MSDEKVFGIDIVELYCEFKNDPRLDSEYSERIFERNKTGEYYSAAMSNGLWSSFINNMRAYLKYDPKEVDKRMNHTYDTWYSFTVSCFLFGDTKQGVRYWSDITTLPTKKYRLVGEYIQSQANLNPEDFE